MKNVSIIGVGLIGGSFALNLKALYNEVLIQGIDHNTKHISQALALDPYTVKNNGLKSKCLLGRPKGAKRIV